MKTANPKVSKPVSRREFITTSTVLALCMATKGCKTVETAEPEPIIDIHQHVGYSGRPDHVLLAHQRAMGISKTILLPAGTPMKSPATHDGKSNGLQAECLGNAACYRIAKQNPRRFYFGSNEVPD